MIRFFDTAQGRPIGDTFTHTLEVKELALSQAGNAQDRQLIFIDHNRDLYVMPVMKRTVAKLGSMVRCWLGEGPFGGSSGGVRRRWQGQVCVCVVPCGMAGQLGELPGQGRGRWGGTGEG